MPTHLAKVRRAQLAMHSHVPRGQSVVDAASRAEHDHSGLDRQRRRLSVAFSDNAIGGGLAVLRCTPSPPPPGMSPPAPDTWGRCTCRCLTAADAPSRATRASDPCRAEHPPPRGRSPARPVAGANPHRLLLVSAVTGPCPPRRPPPVGGPASPARRLDVDEV
jgi:hypothetical protein